MVVFIHLELTMYLKNTKDYVMIMIIVMQKNYNKLKCNHGEKSLKTPWVIYADFECLPIKQQLYQNNPNDSYTEKKAIHEAYGYSLDLVSSFDLEQTKHIFYRGRDCTKKFCKG